MTRDDIIRMAREACDADKVDAWHNGFWTVTQEELERFAALVAAAEREKVARWQIGSGYTTGHGETIEDLLVELEWQVRESEREACAKVCDNIASDHALHDSNIGAGAAEDCAELIRARGQD